MAELNCGGSVQCCAIRIATLEQDGVPLPGPSNLYVTDAITKMDATPVVTKGVDLEIVNACGAPEVVYKDQDRFKRYDLTLDLIYLDPELEQMLINGELFVNGGISIGTSGPMVGAYAGSINGVSLELWTKRIVNGDLDPTWPYVRWVLPRTRWAKAAVAWDGNAMAQSYTGYTSGNPNWYNGPANDWNFPSDTQLMYAYTKTLPAVACGAQALVHS
jgi:hypothetical protein